MEKNYKSAFDAASEIVGILNAPALNGYKCFWSYMAGCMAYYLFRNGQSEYKTVGVQFLSDAMKQNISIKWLPALSEKLFCTEVINKSNDDYFMDCIERMENVFTLLPTLGKVEKKIQEILEDLNSTDGKVFEKGHQKLGELLGYISENPDSTGAPDPYWIINENIVIVSEDKIYEEKEQIKSVPIVDVTEAGRHEAWIKEHENRISKNANIYTILVTNATSLDEEARIYAGEIYYVHRGDFVKWATNALTIIRSAWNKFTDAGEMEWREAVHQEFLNAGITPNDYLKLVCKKRLRDL